MNRSGIPSFERINYLLRPRKQVERKIMIDILQSIRTEIDLSKHRYVGMGSVYFYDFILMHKWLGIDKLTSFDDSTEKKRFEYNKPYEFIEFENCSSTDFLIKYDWANNKTIVWLDYDGDIEKHAYIVNDLEIAAKNCRKNDFLFATVNAAPPLGRNYRETNGLRRKVLENFKLYISAEFLSNKYTTSIAFSNLLQNIFMNAIEKGTEYNQNKFHKLFSFAYKDGAPMYSIGGFFTDDSESVQRILKLHSKIEPDKIKIHDIDIPNLTYREKLYLDSKINTVKKQLNDCRTEVESLDLKTEDEKNIKLREALANSLDIELSPNDIENYLNHYKYFPQYYEGII